MKQVNKIIGEALKGFLLSKHIYTTDSLSNASYSQLGEDLVLKRIFQNKRQGFFIDVGAYHPKYYSNTYLLYLKGWRGINIDAMQGSMNAFKKTRPNDINLEIPISRKKQKLMYYMFEEQAFNGFFIKTPKTVNSKFLQKKEIETLPLKVVLDRYVPSKTLIDLFSIDVEGLDYDVLLSNNWIKYSPRVILVEDRTFNIKSPVSSKIYVFLIKKGYLLYALIPPSLIFVKKNSF